MDVLMEYVGWRSAAVAVRYVAVTASTAMPRATKHSRDTAFIDADASPLLCAVGGVCLWNRTQLSLGTTDGSRTRERLLLMLLGAHALYHTAIKQSINGCLLGCEHASHRSASCARVLIPGTCTLEFDGNIFVSYSVSGSSGCFV